MIERIDMSTAVGVGRGVADAMEGDSLILDDAREAVHLVEPAIEIIARADRVVSGDIGGKDIAVGGPGGVAVAESGDGEIVAAEGRLDDALQGALCPIVAPAVFELAIGGVAGVNPLIPVGDGEGDGAGEFGTTSLPGGRHATGIGRDAVKDHGTDKRRSSDQD